MDKLKENKKLTSKQAIFVREILKGNTQRQACLTAYPKSRNWKKNSLDARASALMKEKAVIKELQRLRKKEEKKVLWNKEIATRKILEIIEKSMQEEERVRESYYEILKIKELDIAELKEDLKNNKFNKEYKERIKLKIHKHESILLYLKNERMIDKANIRTILQCIKLLNKMYNLKKLEWEDIIIELQNI